MPVGDVTRVWPRHLYVRVSGEIIDGSNGSPLEIYSWGIRVATVDGLDGVTGEPLPPEFTSGHAADYLLNTVTPAVRNLVGSGLLSPFVPVTKIGANILVDGDGTSPVYESLTPVEVMPGVTPGVAAMTGGAATNFTNHHPTQVAVAVSLGTNVPRGLASKGRFYLPGPVVGLDPTWRMSTTDRAGIAGRVQTFLRALDSTMPTTGSPVNLLPVVISPLGIGSGGGTIRRVTRFRLGRVLDTQQRRRNALPEDYAAFDAIKV